MDLLTETLVYLVAAIVAVSISRRLGFGSVLGYLAAGIVIGPSALGVVHDPEHILHFAELGVVLLLFVVGLELKPSRLWVMRRMVFGLGSAQVVLSAAALAAVALSLGVATTPAIVIGLTLSLSSTAFVLQMLAEKKQLTSPHGRAAFSMLLLQDLAAIPLIAALPLLSPAADSGTSFSLVKALIMAGTLGGLVVGGRFLLRPVLRFVAQAGIPEIFTATALLVVIGSALLIKFGGMSMVLGAFLAGILLSDSEYRHQLEADIAPFKGLLLGLFFIAVGMTVRVDMLVSEPGRIMLIVALLMLTKTIVLLPLARAFGSCSWRSALKTATLMSQGGEFGFVLFGIALRENILGAAVVDELILGVTVSMMLTPLLFGLVEWLDKPAADVAEAEYDRIEPQHPAVIIAGFGRVGQIVGRVLRIIDQPFTALEKDSSQVDVVRRYGNKVYYGDVGLPELLRAAGAEHAKVYVLAIDDLEMSLRAAETAIRHFPHLIIVARARNRRHAHKLMELGVTHVFRETLLSSLAMTGDVLELLGYDESSSRHVLDTFRERDERLLREQLEHIDSEERLIQSVKDTSRELESLMKNDPPR